MARGPISPLAVADCPHCGWRTYPSPVPIHGSQLHVEWKVPTRCVQCGAELETQTATSATSA
jgi:DNA-directed RNA polymerase subunit RPC12/RpoP